MTGPAGVNNVYMTSVIGDELKERVLFGPIEEGVLHAWDRHHWMYGCLPADPEILLAVGKIRYLGLSDADSKALTTRMLMHAYEQQADGTWVNRRDLQRRDLAMRKTLIAKEKSAKMHAGRWAATRARKAAMAAASGASGAASMHKHQHAALQPAAGGTPLPSVESSPDFGKSMKINDLILMRGASGEGVQTLQPDPLMHKHAYKHDHMQCSSHKDLTLSPSQAQGNPPLRSAVGPVADPGSRHASQRDRVVRHAAPVRQAARRGRPVSASAPPQTSLPMPEATETQPGGLDGGATSIPVEPCDARLDPLAKMVAKEFWPEVHKAVGINNPPECPWGGPDVVAANRFLRENPNIDMDGTRQLLMHRASAVLAGKLSPSARPRKWLAGLIEFAGGPINAFGDPIRPDKRRLM